MSVYQNVHQCVLCELNSSYSLFQVKLCIRFVYELICMSFGILHFFSTHELQTDRQTRTHCGSTKCSPTQYAPFSSILCTLHTQYAPLEHFVYPAYTICYQGSILCRVRTYVISEVVRGYTICSS